MKTSIEKIMRERHLEVSEDALLQAKAISQHYVGKQSAAQTLGALVETMETNPSDNLAEAINHLLGWFRDMHAADLGLALEWSEVKKVPQNS